MLCQFGSIRRPNSPQMPHHRIIRHRSRLRFSNPTKHTYLTVTRIDKRGSRRMRQVHLDSSFRGRPRGLTGPRTGRTAFGQFSSIQAQEKPTAFIRHCNVEKAIFFRFPDKICDKTGTVIPDFRLKPDIVNPVCSNNRPRTILLIDGSSSEACFRFVSCKIIGDRTLISRSV